MDARSIEEVQRIPRFLKFLFLGLGSLYQVHELT